MFGTVDATAVCLLLALCFMLYACWKPCIVYVCRAHIRLNSWSPLWGRGDTFFCSLFLEFMEHLRLLPGMSIWHIRRRWQRSYVPSNLEDILPAIGGAHMALRPKKRSYRDNLCLALIRYFYGWKAAPNNVLGWIPDLGCVAELAAKYIVYGISHHYPRKLKIFR